MKPSFLHRQALRTIHTPAICDSGCRTPETRANKGLVVSTATFEAVHIRGPLSSPASVFAVSGEGCQR